jgi:ribonuclease VapC
MVIDTSIILAIYFAEPRAEWAAEQLARADRLVMSTVNLTETLIRLRDRQPADADALESRLLTSGIEFIAPDTAQAGIAARARLTFPLNLGDCFAYALAKVENQPILTLDFDFRAVDIAVVLPPEP